MKFTKEKEEQLAKLMQDYNASGLEELMDILPDLDFEDGYENELPQQEEIDLDKVILAKEPVLMGDVSCPFSI